MKSEIQNFFIFFEEAIRKNLSSSVPEYIFKNNHEIIYKKLKLKHIHNLSRIIHASPHQIEIYDRYINSWATTKTKVLSFHTNRYFADPYYTDSIETQNLKIPKCSKFRSICFTPVMDELRFCLASHLCSDFTPSVIIYNLKYKTITDTMWFYNGKNVSNSVHKWLVDNNLERTYNKEINDKMLKNLFKLQVLSNFNENTSD